MHGANFRENFGANFTNNRHSSSNFLNFRNRFDSDGKVISILKKNKEMKRRKFVGKIY